MDVGVTGINIILSVFHDLSGLVQPGLNAILGPTGSGKTTYV